MPAATAPKAKRKSTGAAPPAKKARKAVKVAGSESDAGSGGKQDGALSDSDEDVKPKKKVKATKKKSADKSNGTKAKSKAVKRRKSTKGGSGSDQDDESEYAASAVSDDDDDHDFDSDESDGGVKTRVVRDVQKKMPAPKENGQSYTARRVAVDPYRARIDAREWSNSRDFDHPPDHARLSREACQEQRERMVQGTRCVQPSRSYCRHTR